MKQPQELEQALGLLMKVSLGIHNLNKAMEKATGTSLVQWSILKSLINAPGSSAFELAESLGIHPSTLTPSLKRLEKKSYIYVGEDPRDARRKIISVTRQGRETLLKIDHELSRVLGSATSFTSEFEDINNWLAKSSESLKGTFSKDASA